MNAPTDRLYVYAIIAADSGGAFDAPAVGAPGQTVSTLDCGDGLMAVVSATDLEEILSTRRHMLAHTRALETVMADRAILPMRFGMIAASAGALRNAVAQQSGDLREMLNALEGRIEVGVKAVWDEPAIMRQIVAETPQLKQIHDRLAARDEKETYYERIDLGRQVHGALSARKTALHGALHAQLSALSERAVAHDSDDDMTVLNAAYLVGAQDEPALFAAVRAIEAEHGSAFNLKYVSPAPPYNFVSVRLELNAPQPEVV